MNQTYIRAPAGSLNSLEFSRFWPILGIHLKKYVVIHVINVSKDIYSAFSMEPLGECL